MILYVVMRSAFCKDMGRSFSTVFLLVILLKIIACNGFCLKEEGCKNSLPARIKLWSKKDYGLEITGKVHEDPKLKGYDASTQLQVNKTGRSSMKSAVDNLIVTNRKNNYPDFTIHKLDPISYVFERKRMLITFTNVKIINLHTYDNDTAVFTQKGIYERGYYDIDKQTEENIQTEKNKKKSEMKPEFPKRIKPKNDELYILNRRDAKWTINIKANFLSVDPETKKLQPITFVANFKIQPDKQYENAATDDQNVLRSKGRVKIEFHYLGFDILLTITHIDDPLRPFLDSKIKSDNLVPDLGIDYNIREVKILEDSIKLLPYDKDDEFTEKMDKEEHVNDNVPEPKPVEKQPSKKNSGKKLDEKSPSLEKPKYLEDDQQKQLVAQHFKVLAELVTKNTKDISRRMSINLIPKMAWKVMHMETKKQLPFLFHEIIAYNDDFQEKSLLEEFTNKALFFQSINMVKGWLGWFNTPPDPVSLDDED